MDKNWDHRIEGELRATIFKGGIFEIENSGNVHVFSMQCSLLVDCSTQLDMITALDTEIILEKAKIRFAPRKYLDIIGDLIYIVSRIDAITNI